METNRRSACALVAASLGAPALLRAAENDILVGQVGPFTGIPVPDAPQLNEGIKAAFAQINARGGISGRQLSLFEVDDTYTGEGFLKAFADAMKRRPAALLNPVGSVAIKRMLDDKLLDRADVVVVNAVPGAEALRNPGHPRLFHVRAGDRQQIDTIVNHARSLGVARLAVLNQNIPIGTSGLAMATEAAKRLGGIEIQAAEATVEVPTIGAAAARLAQLNPHAALVVGAPRFMADGVAELRKAGLRQFIFILSYVPTGLLVKVAGDGARGVAQAQTFPNPMGAALPVQREFQNAMKAAAPKAATYTSFHFEGYLSARVLAEGLRRTREAGPDALARALRGMGEIDLGGFRVDFSRGNAGSRYVDIAVVNGEGRLVY